MGYLFLLLTVFANIAKSYSSKKISGDVGGYYDAVLVNTVRNILTLAIACVFAVCKVGGALWHISLPMMTVMLLSGIGMTCFVVLWTLAMKSDAYMLVSASSTASFIVPSIIGCVFLRETLTAARVCAFVLVFSAIYFLLRYQMAIKTKISARGLLLLAGIMLSQGVNQAMQKIYMKSDGADATVFTFWTFFFTCITLLVCLRIFPRSPKDAQRALMKKSAVHIVVMALMMFVSSYCQTFAASKLDAIVLYPLLNALSLIGGAVMASVAFGEKMKKDCVIGIVLVFGAMLLSRFG